MSDDEVQALLVEVTRQTIEIDHHRKRVSELGELRRSLFAELRQRKVTIPTIAKATGLHKMTIQQDMQRLRKAQDVSKDA
jgi:IS30 family transposase